MWVKQRYVWSDLLKRAFFSGFLVILFSTAISCSATNSTTLTLEATTSSFNPVSLEVTRSAPSLSLPALHVTITDEKAVQQFYQAAYNLPRLPTSGNLKMHCLAGYDIVYHLKFHSESASDEMDMAPTGCLLLRTSQGLRQESNQFLDLAMKTTHIDPLMPQRHG